MPKRLSSWEKFGRDLQSNAMRVARELQRQQRREEKAREKRQYKREQVVNKGHICKACGHKWISRKDFGVPAICPNCRGRCIQSFEDKLEEEKAENIKIKEKEEKERIKHEKKKRLEHIKKQETEIKKTQTGKNKIISERRKLMKKDGLTVDLVYHYKNIDSYFWIGGLLSIISLIVALSLIGSWAILLPSIGVGAGIIIILLGIKKKQDFEVKYPKMKRFIELNEKIDDKKSEIETYKEDIKEVKNKDYSECLDNRERCPDCQSLRLGHNEEGLVMCEDCGYIFE